MGKIRLFCAETGRYYVIRLRSKAKKRNEELFNLKRRREK